MDFEINGTDENRLDVEIFCDQLSFETKFRDLQKENASLHEKLAAAEARNKALAAEADLLRQTIRHIERQTESKCSAELTRLRDETLYLKHRIKMLEIEHENLMKQTKGSATENTTASNENYRNNSRLLGEFFVKKYSFSSAAKIRKL